MTDTRKIIEDTIKKYDAIEGKFKKGFYTSDCKLQDIKIDTLSDMVYSIINKSLII